MITVEIECEKCNELLENCDVLYCKSCYQDVLNGEIKEQWREDLQELREENKELKNTVVDLRKKLEDKYHENKNGKYKLAE